MQEILGPATSFALGMSLSPPIGKLFMPLFVASISKVGLMLALRVASLLKIGFQSITDWFESKPLCSKNDLDGLNLISDGFSFWLMSTGDFIARVGFLFYI